MSEDGFVVCHVESDEDVEQYLRVLREVFGPDESVDVLAKRLIDHHPEMMLEDHFVIKHKNRIVACLNLIPEKWCIGEIPLKVAEMGCVGTHPEFRHRGLIRTLVNEFHKRVATHGYDLSVIEGIPYFYRQFGYEYAIPLDEEITIRFDQIPDYELKHVSPYAWQIRVTEYVKLFKKMKPLFEKRLAESTYRYLTEKLNFNFRRHIVQMNVENGIVNDVQHLETNEDRTIGLNPLVFVQLLLGYRSRSEIEMIYPDFRIRPSHKHLIDVLFPKLPSYIHAAY